MCFLALGVVVALVSLLPAVALDELAAGSLLGALVEDWAKAALPINAHAAVAARMTLIVPAPL